MWFIILLQILTVENEREQMTSMDTLAAYYVQYGHKEKVEDKKNFILLTLFTPVVTD